MKLVEHEYLQVKRRISREFLGKCGIHAIGVGEAERTVTVSVVGEEDEDFQRLLHALREAARPYEVKVRREPPPMLHSSASAFDKSGPRG